MSTPQTQSQILGDPRNYVQAYLQVNNIIVNERGELKDGSMRNNMDIFATMFLDYLAQVKSHNAAEKAKAANLRNTISAATEKVLNMALQELITKEKHAYRAKIIQSFKCEKEDLSLLRQWVKAVTGQENEDDIAILAHWMWQVKNKMTDKNPSYHVMPILFGKQGGGKTVAMTKLIAPINNFRLNISLDQMTDDRYFKSMSENYVIVFDEMQGAERADIDALKKQVTIEYNDYRPMGTNEVYKVKQACSFIGATNRPIAEQIVDSTGMRRFWQLDCADKLDWDVISNLDYNAMWKGIDENKVDGYVLSQIEAISEKQDQMIAKDDMTLFIEALGLNDVSATKKDVTAAALYQEYRDFCDRNGFKAVNIAWFGRKMNGKGIKSGVKNDPNTKKTINFYSIPDTVKMAKEAFLDDMDKMANVTPGRFGQARN